MNQYMADYDGYFIYPGFGVGGAKDGSILPGSDVGSMGAYKRGAVGGATVGGAAADDWTHFVRAYIGANVTLASLSAGEPAIQVCPVVLRDLHAANYFDPLSPKFKGESRSTDPNTQVSRDAGDFESVYGNGYDDAGNLDLSSSNHYTLTFLDSAFTTYAINIVTPNVYQQNNPPVQVYQNNKKDIPANVIAFIDWNARDGWGANLSYTNWMFNGTNSMGVAVVQDRPKWTNAWWLTEVGFHHLGKDNVYGANYVAMDGHVAWIGSNTISITNFTTGM
jgi:hypothetical protein